MFANLQASQVMQNMIIRTKTIEFLLEQDDSKVSATNMGQALMHDMQKKKIGLTLSHHVDPPKLNLTNFLLLPLGPKA